jgi:DNA replication protein DnaC
LKQIQNSYNSTVSATELGLLQPVFDAEVLVLDDLGSTRPTDWVWDTVSQILNTRYSRNRTTIITTNFIDQPANWRPVPNEKMELEIVAREGTLGDRIGNRMLSRLHEMCVTVPMQGLDIRQTEKKAKFTKF